MTTKYTREDNVAVIKARVSLEDLYDQLAEEAAELAQRANKMARVLRGTNPTPKDEATARKELEEEFTDVMNVGETVLGLNADYLIADYKLYRWRRRLDGDWTIE